MSVIVELSLPATEFQLGRILSAEDDTRVSLETMVPLGGRPVPFFRVDGSARADFAADIRAHETVSDVHAVETHGDETLYALGWRLADDSFLAGVLALDGHVLEASGGADRWTVQIRFPSHDALSEFQTHCEEAGFTIDITRIYNPTNPNAGPWYGLTREQRETLTYAVEHGYYSLPRRVSTQEVADEFGISDQAVTERLRRAIETVATNTLLLASSEQSSASN